MEIQSLIVILSLIAAILAWVSKIFWTKEIIKAKDSTIESLKVQIEQYRNLTPKYIEESYISLKNQLEKYIELLKGQLTSAKNEIIEKEKRISEIGTSSNQKGELLSKILHEKEELKQYTNDLENKLKSFEAKDTITIKIPNINEKDYISLIETSAKLSTQLPLFKHNKILIENSSKLQEALNSIQTAWWTKKGIGISWQNDQTVYNMDDQDGAEKK